MAKIDDPFRTFNDKFEKKIESVEYTDDYIDAMHREYMRQKNYHSHIFVQDETDDDMRWYETSLSDLRVVFPYAPEPKYYNRYYWFAKIDNKTKDYVLFDELGLLILYDTENNTYKYIRSDGKCVDEDNLYETIESLRDAIKRAEKSKEGTIGEIIFPKKTKNGGK